MGEPEGSFVRMLYGVWTRVYIANSSHDGLKFIFFSRLRLLTRLLAMPSPDCREVWGAATPRSEESGGQSSPGSSNYSANWMGGERKEEEGREKGRIFQIHPHRRPYTFMYL